MWLTWISLMLFRASITVLVKLKSFLCESWFWRVVVVCMSSLCIVVLFLFFVCRCWGGSLSVFLKECSWILLIEWLAQLANVCALDWLVDLLACQVFFCFLFNFYIFWDSQQSWESGRFISEGTISYSHTVKNRASWLLAINPIHREVFDCIISDCVKQ